MNMPEPKRERSNEKEICEIRKLRFTIFFKMQLKILLGGADLAQGVPKYYINTPVQ
jgi:hypothetical protein